VVSLADQVLKMGDPGCESAKVAADRFELGHDLRIHRRRLLRGDAPDERAPVPGHDDSLTHELLDGPVDSCRGHAVLPGQADARGQLVSRLQAPRGDRGPQVVSDLRVLRPGVVEVAPHLVERSGS